MSPLPHFNNIHAALQNSVQITPLQKSRFQIKFDKKDPGDIFTDSCYRVDVDSASRTLIVTCYANENDIHDLLNLAYDISEPIIKFYNGAGDVYIDIRPRHLTFKGHRFKGDYGSSDLLEVDFIWSFKHSTTLSIPKP